jgi:apolipoprotein N-acyltransferase
MLDSKPMRTIPLRLWALAVLASFLQVLPFPLAGPVPLWRRLFCWFCLVPLLLALLGKDTHGSRLRPGQTALLGYVCGFFWYLGNCYWTYQTMYLYGGLAKPVALGILLLFSLYLGLYHALFGWLVGLLNARMGRKAALIAAPFLWVAVELARARITGFPWDLLGYTQVDNSLLTKLAPLGGVMLLSFIVAIPSAIFASIGVAQSTRQRLNLLAIGVLLVAGLQLGVLSHSPEDLSEHTAVLLQENLAVGAPGRNVEVLHTQEKYRQFVGWSLSPLVSVTKNGSELSWVSVPQNAKHDLIIWPEAPADFATTDPAFRAQLGSLARSSDTPVIAGSLGVDFDSSAEGGYREYGSAAVFDKDGTYLGRYDKIHRVPWGEYVPYKQLFFFAGKLVDGVGRMDAGTQHTIFQLDGHKEAVFICYESIFGDEVREFVKNGAEVLVNISDDGWFGDTGAPWQHLDMARMRAIENRRWILRDTNTGVTTAIDPHGRGIFSTPRHVRAAFAFPFDYRDDLTFYTRHGDWFAWICALVSAAMLVMSFLRRREVN